MQDPDSLDRHIGARLRCLRQAQRMSLAVFAQRIGVSCPEAQAYEEGTLRIPPHVLHRATDVLGLCPIDLFRDLAVTAADPEFMIH